nr:GNAT family N-acetyltransferase [Streptomyces sp. HNM0574]
MHEVFRDDPVSRWLFPEEAEREARHPLVFRAFLDTALAHGTVELTGDEGGPVTGAALWFAVAGGELAGGEPLGKLIAAAAPGNERLAAMGGLTGERHPMAEDHAYLQAIAVTPGRRRRGLGSALLAPMLERCDARGLPAYLEASSPGSRELYLGLGFTGLGPPLQLPDGPPMWPMWRPASGS